LGTKSSLRYDSFVIGLISVLSISFSIPPRISASPCGFLRI
jgi:hypothetical protein